MSEVSVSKAPSTKEFWESSELLRMVKRVADKTRKSGYAILGWLMVDVLTRISYQTHYESEVGKASLNMLFLMSAPTGGGKSAARKVAKEHFEFEGVGWSSPEPIQAGSGEAIADSYYFRFEILEGDDKGKWKEDWINPNHCRVFYNDEISYHKGKANQNSSTLEATYLSMYSGDLLGRTLAGGKGKEVPAGQYRAVAVFNAQPENDPFRSDSSKASGMPSRLLNLNAVNPNARADYAAVAHVELPSTPFKIPRLGGPGDRMIPQYRALTEMDEAHAEEDFLASEGMREHGRSHTLLTRAKVACLLAALEGREYLMQEDWRLSEHLIEHSNSVDDSIQRTILKATRSEAGKAGAILGLKMGAADETKEQYAIERVAKNIRKWAPQVGYDLKKLPSDLGNVQALGDLNLKISPRDRKAYMETAIALIYNELNRVQKEGNNE
tara:strand:+ start:4073 stop:5392 length:1320 start_codon:yes stop_codon:yes gene_type:complete